MKNQLPIKVVVVGAGARGKDVYAPFSKLRPDLMQIVAVAESDDDRRKAMADTYDIPPERCFKNADMLFDSPKCADMALIATQDRQHFGHALLALQAGYHVLLEKPISPDLDECREIARAARKFARMVVVCHVLRYTPFYQLMKQLLDAGRIGDLVSIHHIEGVAYWHMAHSFVRGNWRNSEQSSPMILQKSSHDMDILLWLSGKKVKALSSFGSLVHFLPKNAPQGAGTRCLFCPVRENCCYDAERIYLKVNQTGEWPTNVVYPGTDRQGVIKALKSGPYGRCVYQGGNNVVDHQVVNLEFEGGLTASFTMCGFTHRINRQTALFGTKGEIYGDFEDKKIFVREFGKPEEILDVTDYATDFSGHGGGDNKMLEDVMTALHKGRLSGSLTSVEVSVQSHVLALRAEQSRISGQVIEIC